MSVTRITEYKAREMIAAAEEILEQMRAGKITGFAWACKFGEQHHGIGLSGNYRADPAQVLSVTSRIDYRVNQLLDGELKSSRQSDTIY